MRKIIFLFLVLFPIMIFYSCGAHTIINKNWKKQGAPKKFNKILVMGTLGLTVERGIIENMIVKDLNKNGLYSISSIDIFPDILIASHDKIEEERFVVKLIDQRIDGVLFFSYLRTVPNRYNKDLESLIHDCAFYDVTTREFLWIAELELFRIYSGNAYYNSFSSEIIEQLLESEVIKK